MFHGFQPLISRLKTKNTHTHTAKNVADLLTKVLFGRKRRELVSVVLADIYDDY